MRLNVAPAKIKNMLLKNIPEAEERQITCILDTAQNDGNTFFLGLCSSVQHCVVHVSTLFLNIFLVLLHRFLPIIKRTYLRD